MARVCFRWVNLDRARFHIRAANHFWRLRSNKPEIFRGEFAPVPPNERLWILVQFPGGAYGGIVKSGFHADFVRALHGRNIAIRGQTLTLDYSAAREFTPTSKSVDLFGNGSVIVSDSSGVELVLMSDSDP